MKASLNGRFLYSSMNRRRIATGKYPARPAKYVRFAFTDRYGLPPVAINFSAFTKAFAIVLLVKIILIDNDGDTVDELSVFLAKMGRVDRVHRSRINTGDTRGYDLAVLSGGLLYSDPVVHAAVYKQEMRLIRTAEIPVFGVCMGFLLIAQAYGAPIRDMPRQTGIVRVTAADGGSFMVFKNHSAALNEPPAGFTAVARSGTGVEAMVHKDGRRAGVQFHPEATHPQNDGGRYVLKLLHDALGATGHTAKIAGGPLLTA